MLANILGLVFLVVAPLLFAAFGAYSVLKSMAGKRPPEQAPASSESSSRDS
jgi:hypothetical protein